MGGRSVQLLFPALSVGSMAANDLVLSDPAVSEQHLVIEVQSDRFVMKDLGSTNGVYVNGVRVRRFVLATGDRLKIGNSDAVVRLR
jgi:pSer/pThr/pTyr-binding forkhead associated (FHA) protein